ncbi:hypothetical protein ACH5RR_033618 [Cinchona calisaya]|uniref:Uncharacterized protein n=1 Tax=Cinchona calisaya TaxID=153742 RepID=A0ABD2YLE8_9GENT
MVLDAVFACFKVADVDGGRLWIVESAMTLIMCYVLPSWSSLMRKVARNALSGAGTMLGYYPLRVLPSKTAIGTVDVTFLPRSDDEREMCARTINCAYIDKKSLVAVLVVYLVVLLVLEVLSLTLGISFLPQLASYGSGACISCEELAVSTLLQQILCVLSPISSLQEARLGEGSFGFVNFIVAKTFSSLLPEAVPNTLWDCYIIAGDAKELLGFLFVLNQLICNFQTAVGDIMDEVYPAISSSLIQ